MQADGQHILINWSPQETRVAVVQDGVVQELQVERGAERGLVGNIYLGKVLRVVPGMQSAFVDIGLERSGFLHAADLWTAEPSADAKSGSEAESRLRMEQRVHAGQSILVQVAKDPISSKGARLTTRLSIAGRMLVYLPRDAHVGISHRIAAEGRQALSDRLQALRQEEAGPAAGGFIVRTQAEHASDQQLRRDMAYLARTWQQVRARSVQLAAPAQVYQDLDLARRVLRDRVDEGTGSIQVDSRQQWQALQDFGREYAPAAVSRLRHYRGERPIFELFGVEDAIAEALGRKVALKCGGYLVIDQTEAMATVDVNTGSYLGLHSLEETVFRTNLEAAQALARQLRLRNLGGIVVVDFIDMREPVHRQAVLAELRKRLSADPEPTQAGDFSALGLVELTRKRSRPSLVQQLCQACPQCHGSGHVRSVRTVAYDILRELLREARQFDPREIRVLAAPEVADVLMDEEGQHLTGLAEFIGKPIHLRAEAGLGLEQYDIVLV